MEVLPIRPVIGKLYFCNHFLQKVSLCFSKSKLKLGNRERKLKNQLKLILFQSIPMHSNREGHWFVPIFIWTKYSPPKLHRPCPDFSGNVRLFLFQKISILCFTTTLSTQKRSTNIMLDQCQNLGSMSKDGNYSYRHLYFLLYISKSIKKLTHFTKQ